MKEVRNVTMSYHNVNNYYHYNSNSSYHLSLSLLLLSHVISYSITKKPPKILLTNEKTKYQKDIANFTYLLTLKPRCVAISDFVSLFSPLHYSASLCGVPYYSDIWEFLITLLNKTLTSCL